MRGGRIKSIKEKVLEFSVQSPTSMNGGGHSKIRSMIVAVLLESKDTVQLCTPSL